MHILTGAVHTGKSSWMLQWAESKPHIRGILSPDRSGKRMLVNLRDGEEWPLDAEPGETEKITVGRYVFSGRAFMKARNILTDLCRQNPQAVIVDEIGKLELQGKGLEPAVSKMIECLRDAQTHLILIIREELLESAMDRYNLQGAQVYQFDKNAPPELNV